jgi:hypothetical protein
MIGMIVIRAMAENDVGLPFADQPRKSAAVLDSREKLTIVNIEDLGGDAKDLGATLDFRRTTQRELSSAHGKMADIAIGRRHELDVVARRGPLGGNTARLEFAVIRMGSKCNNSE